MTKQIKKDKIRENALNVIKGTFGAGFSLFNPIAGMALTAGLEILCIAANSFCDKNIDEEAKKALLENYRSILYDSDSIKDMNQADKTRFVDMAGTVFQKLYIIDKSALKDEDIESIVNDTVKRTFSNTSSSSQKIIEDIVMYAIKYVSFALEDEDLSSYVINENIKRKNEIENLRDNHNKLETRVGVLENKCENSIKMDSHTDNIYKIIKEYANHFIEPLYLHEDNENVNLKNLYVIPRVKHLFKEHNAEDIYSFFSSSFHKVDKPIILAGDAGSGKTTVVSWLAYLYLDSADADTKKLFFCDKELVIIRLRDVDKSAILNRGLTKAICEYLGVNDEKNLFHNKFVIVDGMDEISLTENYVNFGDYFDELRERANRAYKFVITSRSCIVTKDIVFDESGREKYIAYGIEPFTYTDKEKWIKKYEDITGTEILDEVKQYILSRDENTIFDYPQLMYMIAGEKPEHGKWSVNNKWSIYHHIFDDVVLNKEYDDTKHPYFKYRDTVRNVLEIIAYEMYKNNSQTKVEKKRIDLLISELNDPHLSDSEELFEAFKKYGYGLGCYWKIDEDAEIEFYHNNIRDFFIAEFLFRKLNSLFNNTDFSDSSWVKNKKTIAKSLFSILGAVPIRKEVAEFISQRAEYNNQNLSVEYKDSFTEFLKQYVPLVDAEYRVSSPHAPFEELMKELCYDIDVYNEYDNVCGFSIVESVSNFLNNVITVIHSAVSFYDIEKHINVFGADYSTRAEFINSVFRYEQNERYTNLCRAYLASGDLTRTFFNNVNLNGAAMMYSRFNDAHISNTEMKNADLNGAYLISASFENVDLTRSSLSGACISQSVFEECCFTDTFLFDAKIIGNSIIESYIGDDENISQVNESDLIKASEILDTSKKNSVFTPFFSRFGI